MAFGDKLRQLRNDKSLSQSALAEILNVSKSSISMYELGERQPDFETLELIADFFNVDMNFLLGSEPQIHTIAAHHDGEWTEEELEEIRRFEEYVLSKRGK